MREDWIECKAELLGDLLRGVNYKKPQSSDTEKENYLPILRANNIDNNTLNFENLKYVEKNLIKAEQKILKGDIVIAMSSGSKHLVGKSGLAQKDFKGSFGAFCSVYRPRGNTASKFIQNYFHSGAFRSIISNISKGSNINNLKREHILNAIIPLPPLPIQRAIVSKIENLFASLDKGIADLKKAQEQLKIYRQAVLKKAFEGELTKDWREKNFINKEHKISEAAEEEPTYQSGKQGFQKPPISWDYVRLGEIGTWTGGGTPSKTKKEYWENGNVLWVSPKDMKHKVVSDTKDKITEISISNSSAKWVKKGAILIVVRSGIIRRTLPVAIAGHHVTINQDMQSIYPNNNLYSKYVYWFLISNEKKIRDRCAKDGTTVDSINIHLLKNYLICVPSYAEQQVVVREIESRLSVCDKIEQSIKESLVKSEALRQSILKKAFEGELLSEEEIEQCKQEEDYEPAGVLLERIKKEKPAKS